MNVKTHTSVLTCLYLSISWILFKEGFMTRITRNIHMDTGERIARYCVICFKMTLYIFLFFIFCLKYEPGMMCYSIIYKWISFFAIIWHVKRCAVTSVCGRNISSNKVYQKYIISLCETHLQMT